MTKDIDTEWTEYPTCPHCGVQDQDWWDGLSREMHDGDDWNVRCHACQQVYMATLCVSYRFRTDKVTDKELT